MGGGWLFEIPIELERKEKILGGGWGGVIYNVLPGNVL